MSGPRVIIAEELHAPFGTALFESLKFPHSIWRVNRITVSRDGFSYEVYGNFQIKHAGNMAWRLPPATEALDGLKVTAGMAEFRPPRSHHIQSGMPPAHVWHLRVDDPGNSILQTGDRFVLENLGSEAILDGEAADAVDYPDHAAITETASAGRPVFG